MNRIVRRTACLGLKGCLTTGCAALFLVFGGRAGHAAPSSITLTGYAVSADAIRWTWTAADAGTTFTLLTSTGGVVATLAGTASSYTEGSLAISTAYQRKLQQADGISTVQSALVTVAAPDASVVVPLGSPATLVGTDLLTRAAFPASTLPGPGQASVALDPVNAPISSGISALIQTANAKLSSSQIPVPASFREFTVLANGDPFTGNFATAVGIQIPYSETQNPGYVDDVSPPVQAGTLALYTIDTAQQAWVPVLGAALSTANHVVTANVSHFSVYGLIGSNAAADLNSLKAFPNPWRPGSGGPFDDPQGIHFQGLPSQATIKIFSVTGDLVRLLTKQASDGSEVVWDGRNGSGDKTASGIYLFLVTDTDTQQQKTGRLGIVR